MIPVGTICSEEGFCTRRTDVYIIQAQMNVRNSQIQQLQESNRQWKVRVHTITTGY